jgi:uncharacterized membrane protein (DUF106 family)
MSTSLKIYKFIYNKFVMRRNEKKIHLLKKKILLLKKKGAENSVEKVQTRRKKCPKVQKKLWAAQKVNKMGKRPFSKVFPPKAFG